jgi:hypothetical protein
MVRLSTHILLYYRQNNGLLIAFFPGFYGEFVTQIPGTQPETEYLRLQILSRQLSHKWQDFKVHQ